MDIRKGIVVSNTNLIDPKKETPFPWVGILLIIFLNLFCYAGAFYFKYLNQKKVNELKGQIESVKQGRDYKKIALVVDVESRLANAKIILGQRTDWGKFFAELEKNTLPEVVFNSLEVQKQDQSTNGLSALAGSSTEPLYLAELRGTTMGIENLSKQVASFGGALTDKDKPFAKEVNIEKIDLKKTETEAVGEGTEGGKGKALDFSLKVNVNPEILKTDLEGTAGSSASQGNTASQNQKASPEFSGNSQQ